MTPGDLKFNNLIRIIHLVKFVNPFLNVPEQLNILNFFGLILIIQIVHSVNLIENFNFIKKLF